MESRSTKTAFNTPLTTLYTPADRRRIRKAAANLEISSGELVRQAVSIYLETLEQQVLTAA